MECHSKQASLGCDAHIPDGQESAHSAVILKDANLTRVPLSDEEAGVITWRTAKEHQMSQAGLHQDCLDRSLCADVDRQAKDNHLDNPHVTWNAPHLRSSAVHFVFSSSLCTIATYRGANCSCGTKRTS